MAGITPPITPVAETKPGAGHSFILPGYLLGFALVTSLFFLWAIANNFNDILIRQFQKALDLNCAEAGFIQFVFYLGYFLVPLPAGLVIRKFGYRSGILTGLGLYALGALLFFPAAEIRHYSIFLAALFVLASGAAFLETSANPYIVAFGDPARASQRLNLAQAFNGFGAVVAPILGGAFIFSGVEHSRAALEAMSQRDVEAFRVAEAHTVQMPYLVLAAVVILVALAIAFVRLPKVATHESTQVSETPAAKVRLGGLTGAVIAQFFYVGAQVGIWSFFVDFVKDQMPSVPEKTAAYFLSGSLALFMIGRFIGTALMQKFSAVSLLMVFAIINVALCVVVCTTSGEIAVVALGLTSFFMSIMFPTIFSLGVRNLGAKAAIGSSLIIMAIIGGAIFPPLMGLISQKAGGLNIAFALPLICFAVIALYARLTPKSV